MTQIDIAALVADLTTKSAMINMGEKIAWGSETALMDQAADALIAQDAEIKRLRRRMEMQSKYFLRDAKQALAGNPSALRNRVEMMEAEPLEIVLSDEARAALGEKP